ncbi:MAG TPA: ribonuclease Z [Haliangiales bacterium]|nr:ribonuclease Z [Haliangiales bacterium]
MQLVVLGSGTTKPSAARACSGYWLWAGAARVRLDCGAGSVHAMARCDLPWEELTHQFISHFHVDHVGELPYLLAAFKYGAGRPRATPLSLIGPVGLGAYLEESARLHRQRFLEQSFPLSLSELRPGDAIETPDFRLVVARTPHTDESLAVRIERDGRALGYTGDTAPDPALGAFFRGVDLLVAECTFLTDTQGTKHLTADDVAALAAASEARRLLVTHCAFDPRDLPQRIGWRYPGEILLAEDGMVLDV